MLHGQEITLWRLPLCTAFAFLGIKNACDLICLLDWNVSLLGCHYTLFPSTKVRVFPCCLVIFTEEFVSLLWSCVTSQDFTHIFICLFICWLICSKTIMSLSCTEPDRPTKSTECGISAFPWYHPLSGHVFEQTPENDDGQGSLMCGSPWDRKEMDTTEWLNNDKWPLEFFLSDQKKNK